MSPAKAQRRQVRKRCHFDPFGQAQGKLREKSFLDPSHSLGMTGMGSSPLRLGAFAGDNSAFGCGCSPTGEALFPSEVWEKRVLLCLKVFAAYVNFPTNETSRIRISFPPRREERQVRINIISFSLRPVRLCGRYSDSFGCGAAALCSSCPPSW